MRRFVLYLCGGVLLASGFNTGSAGAAELISHRAEYRFFVGKSETRAGSSFEETRTECTAWVQSARMRMHGTNLVPSNQKFEITEFRNGRGMDFLHHLSTGGVRLIKIEGSARRDVNGRSGLIRWTSPKGKVLRMPPATEFATPFYLRILSELRASPGKVIRRTPVFGLIGGTTTGLYYVEARRAKHDEPLFIQVEGDTHLLDAPAIDLEVRLYASRTDGTPVYRIRMKLHENGIFSRAVYTTSRVTITAELARITALPSAKC
ncbi:MAG: cell envelope integrity EipB family protein [Alphaproteobacteria bacterium]|nr:cell envelope integrity EipB family protein [Alphaproteobacteria bacterium]